MLDVVDRMTPRERLERVWNCQEPDRVPIEMNIVAEASRDPRSARLRELITRYVDPLRGWGPNWGYFCLPYSSETKEIENRPGEYQRVQHVYHTPAGDFVAITKHPVSTIDYAWEKNYISTPDDLRRLRDAPYQLMESDIDACHRARKQLGDDGLLMVSVPHPFGTLTRNTLRQDFYAWLILERTLIHDVLDVLVNRVVNQLEYLLSNSVGMYFSQCGMEMALTPWMSHDMFEEYIVPYDSKIYGTIHKYGGKTRIHCHGNAMEYLERFVEIGIDAIEPCEPPPQADVVLKEAKKRVGDHMLLCGNIPSPQFQFMTPDETEEYVKQTISDGAPGGGFILRTTGGDAGTWTAPDLPHVLANAERMIEAGLKYGRYPL